MFQRKPRRFRRRPNDRGGFSQGNGNAHTRLRSNSFSNGHIRNKFKPMLSAEKLFEKYNNLAKEAISTGDKTLAENYLQHADHFMRIIEDKNKNKEQIKTNTIEKPTIELEQTSESNKVEQEDLAKNKE